MSGIKIYIFRMERLQESPWKNINKNIETLQETSGKNVRSLYDSGIATCIYADEGRNELGFTQGRKFT